MAMVVLVEKHCRLKDADDDSADEKVQKQTSW